jgi:hypothetical protein
MLRLQIRWNAQFVKFSIITWYLWCIQEFYLNVYLNSKKNFIAHTSILIKYAADKNIKIEKISKQYNKILTILLILSNIIRIDGIAFAQDIESKLPLFQSEDTGKLVKSSFNIKNISSLQKTDINFLKLSSLLIFSVGAGVFLHNFQKHAWWSGERGHFHIQNDWSYAMSMDKLGHFFVGGLINNTMYPAFLWSGLPKKTSLWMSTLVSIGYMTDIEIEDGFATEWGYSPGDEIFNIAGDAFAVARELWEPLKTVKFKWSYWPTGDPLHKGDFPDDYNGQTFWFSFNVHSYLPEKFQRIWPSYLNFAIGYGVQGYEYYGPGGRNQNLYLSLDYDLRKIIPGDSSFMLWMKEFISNFKIIPAPALLWNTTTGKLKYVVHL